MLRELREKQIPSQGMRHIWNSCNSATCNRKSVTFVSILLTGSAFWDHKPRTCPSFLSPGEVRRSDPEKTFSRRGWALLPSCPGGLPALWVSVMVGCVLGCALLPQGLAASWMRPGLPGHFRAVSQMCLRRAPQGRRPSGAVYGQVLVSGGTGWPGSSETR